MSPSHSEDNHVCSALGTEEKNARTGQRNDPALRLSGDRRLRSLRRMKMFPLFAFLAAALFLLPADVWAKGKPKGKSAPAAAPAPLPSDPGAALAPYINNIDDLFALHRSGNKEGQSLMAEASGRVITLRQAFIGEREKAAEGDRAKFNAAIATCDAIGAALDERQKVIGDLESSQAVQGSTKIEQPARKDNLTQGIKGGSTAKAVGSIVERDRERQAAADAKARTAAGNDAMTAMAENRWNKQALELRKRIIDAYAGIK